MGFLLLELQRQHRYSRP